MTIQMAERMAMSTKLSVISEGEILLYAFILVMGMLAIVICLYAEDSCNDLLLVAF
jgi:hypothetical protein